MPAELQQLYLLPSEADPAPVSSTELGDDGRIPLDNGAAKDSQDANKDSCRKRGYTDIATPIPIVTQKKAKSSAPTLRAPVRPHPVSLMRMSAHSQALPSTGLTTIELQELHLDNVLKAQQRPSWAQSQRHKPPCMCKLDGAMYPFGRCPTYREDLLRRNPMPDPVTGTPPPVEGTSKGRYNHDKGCLNHANRKRPRAPEAPPR